MTDPNAAKNRIDLDEFAAIVAPALIDRHWAELKELIVELRASRKVVTAAMAMMPHFIEQPSFGDHKDGDPYSAGPAYLGPQEPFDGLVKALEDLRLGDDEL